MKNSEIGRNVFYEPIEELNFSVKTLEELKKNKIYTIGDIAKFRIVPELSNKIMEEIINNVTKIPGFHFGMTEAEIACYNIEQKGKRRIYKI